MLSSETFISLSLDKWPSFLKNTIFPFVPSVYPTGHWTTSYVIVHLEITERVIIIIFFTETPFLLIALINWFLFDGKDWNFCCFPASRTRVLLFTLIFLSSLLFLLLLAFLLWEFLAPRPLQLRAVLAVREPSNGNDKNVTGQQMARKLVKKKQKKLVKIKYKRKKMFWRGAISWDPKVVPCWFCLQSDIFTLYIHGFCTK